MFAHACWLGLEGIVSKRRDLPYRSGRCAPWLKIKNPAYVRAATQAGKPLDLKDSVAKHFAFALGTDAQTDSRRGLKPERCSRGSKQQSRKA
jgi:hypothetical protein